LNQRGWLGPCQVHHWNQNGKILHREEDIRSWANGGEVPAHVYMAVLLQLVRTSIHFNRPRRLSR
jgi:hypothetical protein